MKKEELFEALENISPDEVQKAEAYRKKRNPLWVRGIAAAACTVLLAGGAAGLWMLRGNREEGITAESSCGTVKTLAATYPTATAQALSAEEFLGGDGHREWWLSCRDTVVKSSGLQTGMEGYYCRLLEKTLVSENENTVCSPLSTYIAFSMLAEVSEGNTRQQILDMLGAADMATLRENNRTLWNGNYADTPVLKSLLGNSLWLDDGTAYNEETLKTLTEQYYASSFRGTPGTEAMNEALRSWTDENTGGLLTEYTKEMEISRETVLEILSTVYYKAMWTKNFDAAATETAVFHGTEGDTDVSMMKKTLTTRLYRTDTFTALGLPLTDSGSLYLLLPEEGVDVNSLPSDKNLMNALRNIDDGTQTEWSSVSLSLPKFRVSQKTDLREVIRALGVTDALDPALADFTPLTEERNSVCLSKAEQAAVLEIDEDGVTGATYTELAIEERSLEDPETQGIDFILDRPFLFVLTGRDGSLLFAGIVRNID